MEKIKQTQLYYNHQQQRASIKVFSGGDLRAAVGSAN